jgi:hypothetical protein
VAATAAALKTLHTSPFSMLQSSSSRQVLAGALGRAMGEPAVFILEPAHIDCDLPMSRLFLSRNIEGENGRAGPAAVRHAARLTLSQRRQGSGTMGLARHGSFVDRHMDNTSSLEDLKKRHRANLDALDAAVRGEHIGRPTDKKAPRSTDKKDAPPPTDTKGAPPN